MEILIIFFRFLIIIFFLFLKIRDLTSLINGPGNQGIKTTRGLEKKSTFYFREEINLLEKKSTF